MMGFFLKVMHMTLMGVKDRERVNVCRKAAALCYWYRECVQFQYLEPGRVMVPEKILLALPQKLINFVIILGGDKIQFCL